MNAGTLRYSDPKVKNKACSTTNAVASEIINTPNCEARSGRMRIFSTNTPKTATMTIDNRAATHKGRPASVVSTYAK